MKTISKLDYIYERNSIVNLLEYLCNKFNIKIHNVGKYIERNNNQDCFLKNYMMDSTHSSKDYDKVKLFLFNEIIDVNV